MAKDRQVAIWDNKLQSILEEIKSLLGINS